MRGHTNSINSVAISSDNSLVVTGSLDSTAIIWNLTTGIKIFTLTGHSNYINSVAISNDNSQVVTGSSDNTAIIWSLTTG